LAGQTASGNFGALYGTYNGTAPGTVQITANTTLVDNTNANSYNLKSSNNGTFGGVLSGSTPNMDASLTTLAANAPISQNLYYSSNYNQGSTGSGKALTLINASDASGALQILTNSDGSTTIVNGASVSATPIPAAAYLLGSGLLGLFGIRRKNNKA
jgi:hypothetical protein